MKLREHKYAQCEVRHSNGWIILTSYETDVILIDNRGWLYVNGLYSATTRMHIGYFLKEYVPGLSFQAVKNLFKDSECCNIYTGEIAPAADILAVWEKM